MAEGATRVVDVRLSREAYQELLNAERRLHDMLPEYDKAEECGIECQYLREGTADILARIAKMKTHYQPK